MELGTVEWGGLWVASRAFLWKGNTEYGHILEKPGMDGRYGRWDSGQCLGFCTMNFRPSPLGLVVKSW